MLNFKKSLGQNFLVDKNIINKIASIENIKNKSIFEIGPGSGNLTESIISKKPKRIDIIEKDQRFCEILKERFKLIKELKIINKDILKYDLSNYKFNDAVVFGNLPYNISTQILSKFISILYWPPFYSRIIFMFQKEVAERILAKENTKQYGRISILTNLKLDLINQFDISRKCFFPEPKVDSKIIVFKPKIKINYKISNIRSLETVTHTFFSGKRKMINKAFSKLFCNHLEIAKKLKINLNLRPSELTCSDYYRITELYEKQ